MSCKRCGGCRYMCNPNRCYKHPYKSTWAFQPACDDYAETLVRYSAVTTTTWNGRSFAKPNVTYGGNRER